MSELGTALRKMNGKIIINTNKEMFPKDSKDADFNIERAADICNFLKTNEDIEPRRIAISGNGIDTQNDESTIDIIILKK